MNETAAGRRAVLLAALVAALVYLPRLGVPFMWDDRAYLAEVPAYDQPFPASRYLSPEYFPATRELSWRPLSTLSYSVLVGAFGRGPAPLRAANLVLHLAVCALLAALVAALGLGAEAALTAAALFLAHPVHIETVMTVTFDKEILSTLGILVMLLAHLRRRPLVGAAGLALACLAKESGIVGLALAPLLDMLQGGMAGLRRRWKDHLAYAAAAAAYLAVRFGPMKDPGAGIGLSALLPWTERLYYGARAFVSSARVLLAPFGLRIDYFALPASSRFDYAAWVAAALALLGALIVAARRVRRGRPALAFFLLWPLPALFLVSNLVPTAALSLRLMAERWLYLPAVGVCAALAVLLRGRPARARLLLAAWAALGLWRARDWSSETRLWSSLVEVYPWSAKAVEGVGEARYRAGDYPAALAAFEEGLRLRQSREDRVLAHYAPLAPAGTIGFDGAPLRRWLGLCRLKLGDERPALAEFEKAVALQPDDGFSYRVLAYESARTGDFAAARAWLDAGLSRAPDDEFLRRLKPDLERKRLSFAAKFD